MKPLLSLCFFAASLVLGQAALAQTPAVTSSLSAQKVEMLEGKAVLKPATKGKPGDVIEYSGTYRNVSTAGVNKLQATVPVPPEQLLSPTAPSPPRLRPRLTAPGLPPCP